MERLERLIVSGIFTRFVPGERVVSEKIKFSLLMITVAYKYWYEMASVGSLEVSENFTHMRKCIPVSRKSFSYI